MTGVTQGSEVPDLRQIIVIALCPFCNPFPIVKRTHGLIVSSGCLS